MRARNENLDKARKAKFDEFYTLYENIEKELSQYDKEQFRDKVVYVNCDDPTFSNFWKYFYDNFKEFKLKKLVSTYLSPNAVKTEYDGKRVIQTPLTQGGSFDSMECLEELKKCDIIATNPPFSLFRELIKYLIRYDKKFVLIGNLNAITYRVVLPLVVSKKISVGYYDNHGMWFVIPDNCSYISDFGKIVDGKRMIHINAISWYSNLKHNELNKSIRLELRYDPKIHKKIDKCKWVLHGKDFSNKEIINCDRIKDIPYDYYGYIAVPLTIFKFKLDNIKYEIIDLLDDAFIGDRELYKRFVIKIER